MDRSPPRARHILLPAAAAAMALGLLVGLFLLTRAINSVGKEIRELRQKASDLAAQPKVSPTRESLRELEEFLSLWRNGQASAREISQLVTALGEAAQKHHVRLSQYVPKPWTTVAWLRTCDIRLEVTGSTDGILRWFHDISKRGYPLVLRRCELERSAADQGSTLRCSLEFAVYSENSAQ